jgi:1,2-diacylglycerol 3-alpha-glucosyltransferase
MKIAFFSDNFYPELSGIADTIIITGKELKKRGHDICYVAARYSPRDYQKANFTYPADSDADTIDGIPIFRLSSVHVPSPTGQSRFAFPTGSSISFLKTFKPDIIHTQSPYGVGGEGLRAARRLHLPLVGTNHTAIEDFFSLSPIVRAYDAWYYNHCDYVTTPYGGLISRMREKGFRRPARSVANPARLADFSSTSLEQKIEYKKEWGLEGPALLYVGRLGVEKNVDVILRAVAELVQKYPKLTFIATGHGVAESGLKKLVAKLSISRNVRFAGFISPEKLQRLYKVADVFVMMSTSDSQSLALMQAYASGVSAVCARSRGLPDYTPEECGFLVEPGDYHSLAEKLSLLLSNDELRERMGKSARDFVKQFSQEKIALEWEGIYESAANNFKT